MDLFTSVFNYADKLEQRQITEMANQKTSNQNTLTDARNNAQQWASYAKDGGNSSAVGTLLGITYPSISDPQFQAKMDKINTTIAQVSRGIQPKATGGGGDESVDYYAQLLAEGKISVANVPQGIRNAVILASKGIVNKPLSDFAITKINDTNFAISSLNDLRAKIEGKTDQLGPITGLEALNPWSKKRQLQADIDRVRQTVGKALEGGVLRKEDEEKYKKILATITDTPETALYKIDSLISSIQRNIDDYKSLQAETGRFVPTKSGTATSGTTSSGNSYTITKE